MMCAKPLLRVLPSKYVKFPSREGIAEVVSGFENKFGFPQCTGAVDGTHIPIFAPEECAKNYYNRQGYLIPLSCKLSLITAIASLTSTLVGPVQFMMLVYLKTQNYVYVKGQNGTLLPNTHRTINGVEFPVVIL